jgi:lipid A 3-O-deacylase
MFLLLSSYLFAEYGVSFGAGKDASINTYRVGVQKYFSSSIYSNETITLSGFHEVGFGSWRGNNHDKIDVISYSPVFTLNFNSFDGAKLKPYIDAGIGVSYISKKHINDRRFSTGFEFEDRVSLGVSIDGIDVYFRYMHYSNGGFKRPNDGLDIVSIGLNYRF